MECANFAGSTALETAAQQRDKHAGKSDSSSALTLTVSPPSLATAAAIAGKKSRSGTTPKHTLLVCKFPEPQSPTSSRRSSGQQFSEALPKLLLSSYDPSLQLTLTGSSSSSLSQHQNIQLQHEQHHDPRPLKKRRVKFANQNLVVYSFFGPSNPQTTKLVALYVLEFLEDIDIYNISLVNRLWHQCAFDEALWEV